MGVPYGFIWLLDCLSVRLAVSVNVRSRSVTALTHPAVGLDGKDPAQLET